MNETKTCIHCQSQFVIEPDDFTFYKRIDVPAPDECPQCRQQHRILFRNFKTLYKRPSSKSGKQIISVYSPKFAGPVWDIDEWWADDWDPRGFGRDVDFSKPMFPQIHALWNTVPRFALMVRNSVNCEYGNAVTDSRNCYFVFGCVENEDCMYGHIVWNSKKVLDSLYVFKSELCYECVDVLGSYKILYSQESEDCSDSIGLFDCKGCTNCIGCVGLRQKSYHIFNEPVAKEAYREFLKKHPLTNPDTIPMILKRRDDLRRKVPQRHFFGSHNTDVSGNHIYNAKNVHYSFDVKSGENSKFLFTVRQGVDTYDFSFTVDVELGYYTTTGHGQRLFFSQFVMGCADVYYSDYCMGSSNLFGCTAIKNGEYCILNKQYSKEEYDALKVKVISHMKKTGEWGKYFPIEMTPFAYNEAIVNEYFPLTKEEALRQGYRWEDDIPFLAGSPTKNISELPTNPGDFSDTLSKEILACEQCGRNYRITPQEITFYKQLELSLPNHCFNCRHERRMNARDRRVLHPGKCAKCETAIETSYPPDRQKELKIHCEACYLKEMV